MVLATHLVVGVSLAQVFAPSKPVLGFGLGLVSHFLFDALPHWDYQLNSQFKNGKTFISDLVKISTDLALGLLIMATVFWLAGLSWSWSVGFGAGGAVLPDLCQFAYAKLRWRPLRYLQIFHQAVHTKIELRGRPLAGISAQLLLISVIVWFILR